MCLRRALIIRLDEKEILDHAGGVTRDAMEKKVRKELERYCQKQLTKYAS